MDNTSANADGRDGTRDSRRVEEGRASHERGYTFEEHVAELYRLLGYEVQHGRLFAGRQVDLLLSRRLADLSIHRAVECKSGPVDTDDLDRFLIKLRLVRQEYPAVQGTIVSGVSFTDAVASHAAREGVKLTLYGDLSAHLFDGKGYARALLRECRGSDRYRMDFYIEPSVAYEITGEPLLANELVEAWLQDPDWQHLTLLGDVGTGKTFLARMTAYRLALAHLEDPAGEPLPVLIDLRHADRQVRLEGLVLSHLATTGLPNVTFELFQYALSHGRLVLILDGFDEMSARVTPQVTARNFEELTRCVQGAAKVLLTCRTHYFRSRSEELEVILADSGQYASEAARDLYWEIISRKGYRIAYLRPFSLSQVEEYVARVKKEGAKQALRKMRTTYNLMELAHTPLLLEMVVKSIDKLSAEEINPATLYQVYTDAWIHREQWREVFSPDKKLAFTIALARSLWQNEQSSIHHIELAQYVQKELASEVRDPRRLVEMDSEIRVATFLTRDDLGSYSFAHKSFGEFFLAKYLASELTAGNVGCLQGKRLSVEVVRFLQYLLPGTGTDELFERVLVNQYTPLVSENALVCLYGVRRGRLAEAGQLKGTPVPLPEGMQLQGARLDLVNLERALMKGADLTGASMREATLTTAVMKMACLSGADLTSADLRGVEMTGASLRRALLPQANLEDAELDAADLSSCDLTQACLIRISAANTSFLDAKLSGALTDGELRDRIRAEAGQVLSANAQLYEGVENSEKASIELLWPKVIKAAESAGVIYGADVPELASSVLARILTERSAKKLATMSPKALNRRLTWMARQEWKGPFELPRKHVTLLPATHLLDVVEIAGIDPAHDQIAYNDLMEEIRRIVSDAPARMLQAIFVEGYTIEEVAQEMSMEPSEVRSRVTKALAILGAHRKELL